MRKGRCGAEIFGISYVEKVCFALARRSISKVMLFYCGKHHFLKQAFRLGHIHVFKFMRCFAMAKQHFQHAHVNQKGSMGNQNHRENKKTRFQNQWVAKTIEKTSNTRKPLFQNQWVAKTIERTKQNKKTKISEPRGNQHHRENSKNKTTKISEPRGNQHH